MKECTITKTKLSTPITFEEEDLLFKNIGYNRPLYFIDYKHKVSVPRVQIDPESSITIMPARMLQQVGLTNCLIKESNLNIHGFDGKRGKAIGKIRIWCQIGDMHSQLICYIIEAATAYNLLLGRPWIHENCVVPHYISVSNT